jgi:hypothetical protein
VWVNDKQVWLCHPDGDWPDCYHMWTVYGRSPDVKLVVGYIPSSEEALREGEIEREIQRRALEFPNELARRAARGLGASTHRPTADDPAPS